MRFALTLLAGTGALLAFAGSLQAQHIIYQQTFGNSTGDNTTLRDIGSEWEVHSLAGGGVKDVTETMKVVSLNGGSPTTEKNVGTGSPSQSETHGFLFIKTPNLLAIDTKFEPIDPNSYSSISFSWMERDSSPTGGVRLAVRIGSEWFASEQLFNVAGESSAFQPQKLEFTKAASAWRNLTFSSSNLSLAASVRSSDLPAGQITGFGFFTDGITGYLRLDTFAISVTKK